MLAVRPPTVRSQRSSVRMLAVRPPTVRSPTIIRSQVIREDAGREAADREVVSKCHIASHRQSSVKCNISHPKSYNPKPEPHKPTTPQ